MSRGRSTVPGPGAAPRRRRSLPHDPAARLPRVIRRRPGTPAAPRAAGRCRRPDGRARRPRAAAPQTMHRPGQSGRHSGAIGSASEIASRPRGSRSTSWWSVRRSASGSSSRATGLPRREVDASAGTPRRCRARAGSRCPGGSGCTRPRARSSRSASASTPRLVRRQPDRPVDRRGQARSSGRSIVTSVDRVLAVGPDGVGQEPGHVPDERPVRRAGGHGARPAAPRPPARRPSRRRPRRARRRPPGRGRPAARRASRSPS